MNDAALLWSGSAGALAALAVLVAFARGREARRAVAERAAERARHAEERERLQRELEEARARGRELAVRDAVLAQNPRLGHFTWSLDDDALSLSPHWGRLLEAPENEVPTRMQALREQLHPADLDRLDDAIQAHLDGAPWLDCEVRVRSAAGRWHWLHLQGRLLGTDPEDVGPHRLVGSFHDVHALKLAEEALASDRRLFDAGPVIVVTVETAAPQRLVAVSASAWRALRQPRGTPLVGRPLAELLDREDAPAVMDRIAGVADQPGAGFQMEARLRLGDGGSRWHSVHALAVGPEGRQLRAYLLDVERLKQAEREAAAHARRLEDVVERTAQSRRDAEALRDLSELIQCVATQDEAFALVGERGRQLFPAWSGALHVGPATALERMAGWGADADAPAWSAEHCWALRRGRLHRSHGADGGAAACEHFDAASPPAHSLCVPLSRLPNGEAVLVLQAHAALAPPALELAEQLAGSFAETVRLSLSNLQLRLSLQEQATRDWMTGLHNRRYFEERLPLEIGRAGRAGEPLVLAILDIDHFKSFNDRFGHDAGDTVIRHVARELAAFGRSYDLRCRLGGEELGILIAGTGLEESRLRLEALRERISAGPVRHESRDLPRVTVSIGLAQARGGSPEELVRRADVALYAAKRSGRNRTRVWSPTLDDAPEIAAEAG